MTGVTQWIAVIRKTTASCVMERCHSHAQRTTGSTESHRDINTLVSLLDRTFANQTVASMSEMEIVNALFDVKHLTRICQGTKGYNNG